MRHLLCQNKKDNQRITRFLTNTFPRDAQGIISSNKGIAIESRGQGIAIFKCRKVTKYKVLNSRSLTSNNKTTCYRNLLIKENKDNSIRELEPISRTLHHPKKRNCSKPAKTLLIRDKKEIIYKFDKKNHWSIPREQGLLINSSIPPPKFQAFNEENLHKPRESTSTYSLLETMQETKEIIGDMSEINKEQQDALNDILGDREGIVMLNELSKKGKKVLKRTESFLAKGSLKILKQVAAYSAPFFLVGLALIIIFKIAKKCLRIKSKGRQEVPPRAPAG